MKHYLLIISMLISLMVPLTMNAQEFENGDIGIVLGDYGRVRIFAPDYNTRQIDRFSILVAGQPNEVFDYSNDAETVDSSRNIDPPSFGDYELYVSTDNSYSSLPPNLVVNVNVYGWNSGGYALAKFTVVNNESTPLNAKVGFEVLPQIDGLYGFESVQYLPDAEVVRIHVADNSTNVGLKVLSHDLESLASFAWYNGYNDSDVDLYNWLTYGAIDTLFESTDSGSVAIIGTPNEMMDPGDTIFVYVGIAVGNDENEVMLNMSDVQMLYEDLVTAVPEVNDSKPDRFELYHNYPNPFNPSTQIEFSIPQESEVCLSIYNSLGEKIATLLNERLSPGIYSTDFNAAGLSTGVYFYRLIAGQNSEVKKMMLIK